MAWGAVAGRRGRVGRPQTREGPPEEAAMGAAEAAVGVAAAVAAAVAVAQAELVTVGAGHCASFLCQKNWNTHWISLVLDSLTEK